MYLKNSIKKIVLSMIMINIFLCSYTQNKPIFDSGYYFGVCQDGNLTNSKYIKYLYLQFLSNGGDSMLIVIPYKLKNSNNENITDKNIYNMNDTVTNYLSKLSKFVNDRESCEKINRPWTINGFTNFPYYDLKNNKLSFSINIVPMMTDSLEIFDFEGIISKDGCEIYAIIWSDKGTFKKSKVKLTLEKN